MIEETPDPEKASKRSSFILDNAGEGPSNVMNEKATGDNMSDQRLSAWKPQPLTTKQPGQQPKW
jgi:hypothetical protein